MLLALLPYLALSAPSFEEVNFLYNDGARAVDLVTLPGTLRTTPIDLFYNECDVSLSYYPFQLGYKNYTFRQSDHYLFDQETFHNGVFAIGLQGAAPCNLSFMGNVFVYVNLEQPQRTTLLSYVVGQAGYTYDAYTLQCGLIYRTGLNQNRFWPIFGIEWIPQNLPIELHLVYPVNLALIYRYYCWSFGCRGRYVNTRQRTCEKEFLHQGVLQYKNWGVEGVVNYTWCEFSAELSIGHFFNGRLLVDSDDSYIHEEFSQQNVPYLRGGLYYVF